MFIIYFVIYEDKKQKIEVYCVRNKLGRAWSVNVQFTKVKCTNPLNVVTAYH